MQRFHPAPTMWAASFAAAFVFGLVLLSRAAEATPDRMEWAALLLAIFVLVTFVRTLLPVVSMDEHALYVGHTKPRVLRWADVRAWSLSEAGVLELVDRQGERLATFLGGLAHADQALRLVQAHSGMEAHVSTERRVIVPYLSDASRTAALLTMGASLPAALPALPQHVALWLLGSALERAVREIRARGRRDDATSRLPDLTQLALMSFARITLLGGLVLLPALTPLWVGYLFSALALAPRSAPRLEAV